MSIESISNNSKRLLTTFILGKLKKLQIEVFQKTRTFRSLFYFENIFQMRYSSKSLKFGLVIAKVLANYIAFQLKLSQHKRDIAFRFGFRKGLVTIGRILFLSKFKEINLIGLKIYTSGRLSKTKTGRTQSLSLSIGRLAFMILSEPLSFGFSNVITRHGSCSIKV
jgi:hypothetical protein